MEIRTNKKVALVTGSSGGIGSAISRTLLDASWVVIGIDILKPPLHLSHQPDFYHIRVDLKDGDSVVSNIGQLLPTEGLDAVIYAAGSYDHFPLAEAESGRLEALLSVNVLGFASTVRASFDAIIRKQGRYIVISSETAMVNLPFQVYGVTKGMLEVYCESLRQELKLAGVALTIIRPGAHQTPLLDSSRGALASFRQKSRFAGPLSKVRDRGQSIIDKGAADPKDIARAVLKSLEASRPAPVKHVNVSMRFRIMSLLPARTREAIVTTLLQ